MGSKILKAASLRPSTARTQRTSGVADCGAREEDDPVTWEAHVCPRERPELRGPGDHSPTRRVSAEARAAG